MPDSIKTSRIALVVAAGLAFATAALLVFIFVSGAVIVGWGTERADLLGSALLGFAGIALAAGFAAFGVVGLVIAGGIARGLPWSRYAGAALAAILCVGVPVGTILGIVALTGLFGADARDWFGPARLPRRVPPVPPTAV
ncbi:MAG TPA: hypothetical protein ENO03_01470 [Candidatus Aminicenantes bacterium]|nr:hypothetical protein [Candidatus Aminicenantes bacterium]HDT13005.1 hypothetical protein [Candidatus Aminicenantes bacterium]